MSQNLMYFFPQMNLYNHPVIIFYKLIGKYINRLQFIKVPSLSLAQFSIYL